MAMGFCDGSIATQAKPSHRFKQAGEFTVSLQIIDTNGCRNQNQHQVAVTVFTPPAATFSAVEQYLCSPPLQAAFNNQSTGNAPLSFNWFFGDGSTSAETAPNHTYLNTGIYSVTLNATDSNGCTASTTKNNYLIVEPITAIIKPETNVGCPNQTIGFTNLSANATSCLWDFGDAQQSSVKSPSHTYAKAGNYTISLTANRGNCTHTTDTTIVIQHVQAYFTADNTYACETPHRVNFTNQSAGAIAWMWDFGDETTTETQHPTKYYVLDNVLSLQRKRSYTVSLTATSPAGCTHTFSQKNAINIVLPTARFNYSPSDGCVPLVVNFTNTSSYNSTIDQIKSLTYNFNDGTTSTTENPSHNYTQFGTYHPSLTITTNMGCSNTAQQKLVAGTLQKASFSKLNPHQVCATDTVKFINQSTDFEFITQMEWLFGDGSKTGLINPKHLYTDTGSMIVSLTVNSNGCKNDTTINDFVYIASPMGTFSYTLDCADPFLFIFKPNLKGATSFEWDFGDGSAQSTDSFPKHRYAKLGMYTVSLKMYNANSQCSYLKERTVYVQTIKAAMQGLSSKHCLGHTDTLVGTGSEYSTPFTHGNQTAEYLWLLPNEKTLHSNKPVAYKHDQRGKYDIGLVVQDINGCRDTAYQTAQAYVPNIDFTIDTIIGCLPATVSFINKTTSDTTIAQWNWDFGDNNNAAIHQPTHSYNIFGKYNVTLWAKDAMGCSNQRTLTDAADVSKPNPTFVASKTNICAGDSIQLIKSQLQTDIATHKWTVNAQPHYVEERPYIQLNTSGAYSISLQLTDFRGCDSATTRTNYIQVQDYPTANFSADSTFASCYPFLVHFSDLSTGTSPPVSWKWNFGDSPSWASGQTTNHNYLKPNSYNVSFVASTSHGCSDTIIKNAFINIKGAYAEIVAPDSSCKGIPVPFALTNVKDIDSLNWVFGDGTHAPDSSITHTYDRTGLKQIALELFTDKLGTCTPIFLDSIYLPPLNAGFMPALDALCINDTLWLTDNSTGSAAKRWSLNGSLITNGELTNHVWYQPGTYQLKQWVSDNEQCTDSMKRTISVHPLPSINLHSDTTICQGSEIQLWASGGRHYSWQPIGSLLQANTPQPMATPSQTTHYQVLVTDSNQCTNTASMLLKVHQPLQVQLTADTAIIIGRNLQLGASSEAGASYLWQPDQFLNCTNCQSPFASKISESLEYTVTATDSLGCFQSSASTTVEALQKYSIALPAAFSPDGDGVNDILYVDGWGVKEVLELKIYNRLGELVAELQGLENGWDGNYKGTPAPPGIYLYRVTVETYNNETTSKTGDVLLLK